MNSNTQKPNLMTRITNMFLETYRTSYEMMKIGMKSLLPTPGVTGWSTKHKYHDQINDCKSMRQMRKDWGHPEDIGDRRFIRYQSRFVKRKNSFGNNAQELTQTKKTNWKKYTHYLVA